MSLDRPVRLLALVAAAAAAFGSLVVDNDLETTLFMAAAVIAALAAFDVALDRHAAAFWPWMLVAVAILAKTIPSVIGRLLNQFGPPAERTLHLSSVLFGLCLAVAATAISRPPTGSRQRIPHLLLPVLAGATVGLGAAAAAFAGRGGFATTRSARLFETLGWGLAAAIVMAVVLLAALLQRHTIAAVLLGLALLPAAVLVARTAAGHRDDLGWWAFTFVFLAAGALLVSPASLGGGRARIASRLPAVASVIVAALGAVAGFIGLTGDGATIPSLGSVVAAGALAFVGFIVRGRDEDDFDVSVYRTIARDPLQATDAATPTTPAAPRSDAGHDAPMGQATGEAIPTGASAFSAALGERIAQERSAPHAAPPDAPGADGFSAAVTSTAEDGAQPAASKPPAAALGHAEPRVDAAPDPRPATPPYAPHPLDGPPATLEPVVVPPTSSLPAHFVDPQTGLHSAASLQQGLTDAFARPRNAGEVSVLMVALGRLPDVEARYGRIAATQAIAELARRLQQALPEARVARFSTDGFAALFDGPALETQPLVDRCTDVLLDLLDPVRVGTTDIEIDVAAGMAQCYAREDIASFLGRANQGLVQAVRAGEPTLIAMP